MVTIIGNVAWLANLPWLVYSDGSGRSAHTLLRGKAAPTLQADCATHYGLLHLFALARRAANTAARRLLLRTKAATLSVKGWLHDPWLPPPNLPSRLRTWSCHRLPQILPQQPITPSFLAACCAFFCGYAPHHLPFLLAGPCPCLLTVG